MRACECTLPEAAFYVVRYHSFYAWHTGGGYGHLLDDHDRENLRWVREFNKFDLYTKGDSVPDVEALKPYYQGLIAKCVHTPPPDGCGLRNGKREPGLTVSDSSGLRRRYFPAQVKW